MCRVHGTGNFTVKHPLSTQDFCMIIQCENGPALICCPTEEQTYCICLPSGDPFCKCL